MTFSSKLIMSVAIGALALSACGGGSSSNTTSQEPNTPPPPSGNQAPVPVASGATTVTQSGSFTVSAENSSDPEGDNLSFTWAQTAGPNVLPGETVQATNLTLNAPTVTQDTVLTFEVTVSDGTNETTDSIDVTVQPIASPVTIRPIAPINADVAALNGITSEGDDQYRLYWTDGFALAGNDIIASQVFSDSGAPIGDQRNGSFDLPQAGPTFSTQINALIPLRVIENGGTVYAPLVYIFENAVPFIGNLVGPLEGNLSPVDDPEILFDSGEQFDFTPIGQNNVINVTSSSNSVSTTILVNRFNPDGSIDPITAPFLESAPPGDPLATVSTIINPAVSAIGTDGYIVAWRREDTAISPTLRTIEAQIYTSEDNLSGETITLDMTAGPNFGGVIQLDAAAFGNGNNLISWVESQDFAANGDFIDFVIKGRVVSPEGTFVSDEFSISESDNDQFNTRSLSLNNGDVLVVWGEDASTIKARLVSTTDSGIALGSEFTLTENANPANFFIHQTTTGRVLLGYNLPAGNSAFTSEIVSFCPVGCD